MPAPQLHFRTQKQHALNQHTTRGSKELQSPFYAPRHTQANEGVQAPAKLKSMRPLVSTNYDHHMRHHVDTKN